MSELKSLSAFDGFGKSSREQREEAVSQKIRAKRERNNNSMLPENVKEKLRKFPLNSQYKKGMEAEVIVQFSMLKDAGTWLITEGEEQENGDWELFGYCCISEWEWGSVMLSELDSMSRDPDIAIRCISPKDHARVIDLVPSSTFNGFGRSSKEQEEKKRTDTPKTNSKNSAENNLLSKIIRRTLRRFPLHSQRGKGLEAEIIAWYFVPYGGGTWLITEGEERADGDWELFGYCRISEWEWGSIMLSELDSKSGLIKGDILEDHTRVVDFLPLLSKLRQVNKQN